MTVMDETPIEGFRGRVNGLNLKKVFMISSLKTNKKQVDMSVSSIFLYICANYNCKTMSDLLDLTVAKNGIMD